MNESGRPFKERPHPRPKNYCYHTKPKPESTLYKRSTRSKNRAKTMSTPAHKNSYDTRCSGEPISILRNPSCRCSKRSKTRKSDQGMSIGKRKISFSHEMSICPCTSYSSDAPIEVPRRHSKSRREVAEKSFSQQKIRPEESPKFEINQHWPEKQDQNVATSARSLTRIDESVETDTETASRTFASSMTSESRNTSTGGLNRKKSRSNQTSSTSQSFNNMKSRTSTEDTKSANSKYLTHSSRELPVRNYRSKNRRINTSVSSVDSNVVFQERASKLENQQQLQEPSGSRRSNTSQPSKESIRKDYSKPYHRKKKATSDPGFNNDFNAQQSIEIITDKREFPIIEQQPETTDDVVSKPTAQLSFTESEIHKKFINSGLRRLKSDESRLYLGEWMIRKKKKVPIKPAEDGPEPLLQEIPSDQVKQRPKEPIIPTKEDWQDLEDLSSDENLAVYDLDGEDDTLDKLKDKEDVEYVIDTTDNDEDHVQEPRKPVHKSIKCTCSRPSRGVRHTRSDPQGTRKSSTTTSATQGKCTCSPKSGERGVYVYTYDKAKGRQKHIIWVDVSGYYDKNKTKNKT